MSSLSHNSPVAQRRREAQGPSRTHFLRLTEHRFNLLAKLLRVYEPDLHDPGVIELLQVLDAVLELLELSTCLRHRLFGPRIMRALDEAAGRPARGLK